MSASIQGLYEAMGRGEVSGFTVPAINIRALTYDTAQAVFRAALAAGVGAMIFEIARSEIDYTRQRPEEYTCAVTAAAQDRIPGTALPPGRPLPGGGEEICARIRRPRSRPSRT